MKYLTLLMFGMLLSGCDISEISYPSDQLQKLPVLDASVSDDALLSLRANKNINREIKAYFSYQGIKLDGFLRPSGAASRGFFRWSYRVRLENGEIEGLNLFNLSAQVHDPTMMKTRIVTWLYREAGFPVFQNRHLFLRINGKDEGLYPALEKIDNDFFEKRNIALAELYKAGSRIVFSFDGPNVPKNLFDKEYPKDDNFSSINELFHALDTCSLEKIESSLGRFLDVRLYLKYHALTSVINNVDAFRNNFFLHKESPAAPFKIIPWDFDLSFNTKRDVGLYGKNEIIEKMLQNEVLFNQYKNNLRTITDTLFTEAHLFPLIDSTAAQIEQGYNIDPALGNGRFNFNDEKAALKDFISNRRQYYKDRLSSFTFPQN